MICKEDVVSWFKELESYKRIDTMCTLLNMCLPFELRFLGTVLEELGRRDSQELRGIELRVNNSQELAADIATCQSGEPTDKKIRRKMAMFLALIRACNRPCVNELFKTLDGWGERDFAKINDTDPLQELLLVYTMATNHPVFSFDQRMKCGEIFNKINDNSSITSNSYQHDSSNTIHQHIMQQQHLISNTPPLQQQSLQPQSQNSQILTQSIRWEPMSFTTNQIPQMITSADGTVTPQIAIDPITQMQLPVAIPTEFTGPPPQWLNRHHMQQLVPSPALDTLTYTMPPQSSSPMMSQPSSPAQSRATSPIRNSLQQQHNTSQHRGSNSRNTRPNRRPSVDTTPPPTQQQQQQQQTMQNIGVLTNDLILQHNVKYEDIPFNIDAFALQPQVRNGYSRTGHHTIPRPSKGQLQQQQQQHQQHQQQLHFQTNTTNIYSNPHVLQYHLQNLTLGDVTQLDVNTSNSSSSRKKSGGSDSGSSIGSSGEISPPDTPHLVNSQSMNSFQTYKQQKQNRINGRPDKLSGTMSFQQQGGPTNNSPQIIQNFIPPNSDTIVPSTIANNNNNSNSGNGNNNNFVQSNLIMSGPSLVSPTTGSLVNPIMLQQQPPQQYSASFSYPQHSITTSSRPPILPHPQANTFRQHSQMHGGEPLVYQYPHTHTISFIPNTTSLRSSPSSIQQQSPVITVASPFSISNKSSCFNCGSQSHVGRDCQEASMEDVTRGAIYKLDYNAATSSSLSLQTGTIIVSDNSAATLLNDITAQTTAANSSNK